MEGQKVYAIGRRGLIVVAAVAALVGTQALVATAQDEATDKGLVPLISAARWRTPSSGPHAADRGRGQGRGGSEYITTTRLVHNDDANTQLGSSGCAQPQARKAIVLDAPGCRRHRGRRCSWRGRRHRPASWSTVRSTPGRRGRCPGLLQQLTGRHHPGAEYFAEAGHGRGGGLHRGGPARQGPPTPTPRSARRAITNVLDGPGRGPRDRWPRRRPTGARTRSFTKSWRRCSSPTRRSRASSPATTRWRSAPRQPFSLPPGVTDKVIVVGFDGSDDAIASIGQGELKATSLQPVAEMANQATHPGRPVDPRPASTGKDEKQSIDCVVINAANADTYTLFALE